MMISFEKTNIKARLNELREQNNLLFNYFIGDFNKAIAFYHAAVTKVNREVTGEDERKANRYARVLIAKNGLNIKVAENVTGMQILAALCDAGTEEIVCKMAGNVA